MNCSYFCHEKGLFNEDHCVPQGRDHRKSIPALKLVDIFRMRRLHLKESKIP